MKEPAPNPLVSLGHPGEYPPVRESRQVWTPPSPERAGIRPPAEAPPLPVHGSWMTPMQPAARAAVPAPEEKIGAPEKVQCPMTAGQLVLYIFLMLIPAVNLILALVWSFAPRTGAQKQALARAALFWILVGWMACMILLYLALANALPQVNAILDVLFSR